ncbi:MAG: helix-turn-helix domain-containing protein [Zoogloeaceae bacterium]|jgi:transcriptional regulator with XRE-family HTH domain|nr:helix-turn-helix domain-containing protein [Zoogloeaceae bacterium]
MTFDQRVTGEMMEEKSVFGKRLQSAREKSGLTQKELGRLLGLEEHSSAIGRFESGTHMPHYAMTEKIAAALNTPVLYFYCADEALATMFALLGECLGDDWKVLLLRQMRETLVQGLATRKQMNADDGQRASGWPHMERRTQRERRIQGERRCVERRSQTDRRGSRLPEGQMERRGGTAFAQVYRAQEGGSIEST